MDQISQSWTGFARQILQFIFPIFHQPREMLYNLDNRHQCYETFFLPCFEFGQISQSIFLGKAWQDKYSRLFCQFFINKGKCYITLTISINKHQCYKTFFLSRFECDQISQSFFLGKTWQDKCSRLFCLLVTDKEKQFYNLDACCQSYKLFIFINQIGQISQFRCPYKTFLGENAIAYFATQSLTKKKSFITQMLGINVMKLFSSLLECDQISWSIFLGKAWQDKYSRLFCQFFINEEKSFITLTLGINVMKPYFLPRLNETKQARALYWERLGGTNTLVHFPNFSSTK